MSRNHELTLWECRVGNIGHWWELWRSSADDAFARSWHEVKIPHCVNARDAVDPDTCFYQGPTWYRSWVDFQNPYHEGRTWLRFHACGQRAQVWVYDTLVYSHAGGYTAFSVDITEAIQSYRTNQGDDGEEGEAVPIAICADNSRDCELIPSDLSDFNVYGGLYRPVECGYEPAIHLDDLNITNDADLDSQSGTIQLNAKVCDHTGGNASEVALKLRLQDPEGRMIREEVFTHGEFVEGVFQKELSLESVQWWSPEQPNLYAVDIQLESAHGISECRQQIGFRHFSFEPHGPFYLNGERLLLKGTHVHEDHAGIGAATTKEIIRRDLELMKEMGVNCIRLGHYPHSEYTLEQCDQLGFLVWEEIPWCRGGVGGASYREHAHNMLVEMIHQHKHHPSIILWGLGNENDWPGDFPDFDEHEIQAFMKELHDRAKALDPGRLTAIRRCEFCKDMVDVYSPSIWAGWYRGRYEEYADSACEWRDKVPRFLHAEWGGDSHVGRHEEDPKEILEDIEKGQGTDEREGDYLLSGGQARVSKDSDWSETYICDLFEWHLKEQQHMPWLTGALQWVFKDFSTPLRPDNPVPYVNQKGVVCRDHQKKEAYYVFQSYWTEELMVRIYGHTWPVRWRRPGETNLIRVYSNADCVELLLNNRSQGKKLRNPDDFPCAGLRWELELDTGEHVLEAVAHKNGVRAVDQLSFVVQDTLGDSPSHLAISDVGPAEPLIEWFPDLTQHTWRWIEVRMVDAAGAEVLNATNHIYFSICGQGRLIDNLGTPDGSRKVGLANGRARIRVAFEGPAYVAASIPELPPAFHHLSPHLGR